MQNRTTREDVIEVLKRCLRKVSEAWREDQFHGSRTMEDMGIDSLDSVNVIFTMMKELKVKLPKGSSFRRTSFNEIIDSFLALLNRDARK